MNTSTSRGFSRRPVMALAAAVTLVLGFSAPVQQAQAWIPVQETGFALFNHIMNQLNTYAQRYQDIDAYNKQWQRIKSMYVKMQSLMTLQFKNGVELKPVDEMEGVNENCRSSGSSNPLSNVLSLEKLNVTGKNVLEEQQKICIARQVAMNRKFNVTVQMMDVLKEHAKQFEKLESDRMGLSGENPGENDGVSRSMQSLGEQIEQDLNRFDMVIKTYDNYIAALNERQQMLARAAMENDTPKGIGEAVFKKVVQGVTLKGALDAARVRER